MQVDWLRSCLWASLAVCWAGALAQEYVPTAITFSGTDLSQAELLAFTGLKPGEPVARDRMQAAAERLTASGLFDKAGFSFDGATLTFELAPSAAVVPVEYDNFPWWDGRWDDKALNAAVAERVPLFHGALYPGGPMREEVVAALTTLLAAKGVEGATISTAPVGDKDGTQVAILYHIDSPAVVVAGFHIEGYSGVWTQPLEAVEKAAFRQKLDRGTRDRLADQMRAVYGDRGFIDMTMTGPEFGEPKLVNGEVTVPLRATITSEGGQYHVAGIHLSGDLFMTQEQFAARVKLHPGDVADAGAWKQVQEMVMAQYRTHGYLDAKVDTTPVLDRAQHAVDYTITVTPGAVYRMGALTVVNLNEQQKADLMPYWLLHAGDVFDPDRIPQSIANYHAQRAEKLQLVRAGYAMKWTGDPQTHVVNVVLTFDVAQTGASMETPHK